MIIWCCAPAWAQHHIVYNDAIASLQVVAEQRWQQLPIITLGTGERINVSFDELSHEYHRYTYRIVHLESDWTESTGLIASDYLSGFSNGTVIDECEESVNTTQNYTHYRLQIPNKDCQLKISGNYRLDILDDNNGEEPVLSAFFLVNEDRANIGIDYTTDTDIDNRKSHQQVEVKVDYNSVKATDPRNQIKCYVLQNYRWDNMVKLPVSTGINQQYMEWTHCRDLIFDAGNEYHKFEILDIHRNSFNVENNSWDEAEQMWHTYVWPDYRRPSYVYDETPKGAFYIRNSDNRENDVTSEYVMVHFTLETPEPFPYPVYVNGLWTSGQFSSRYRMDYDSERMAYVCAVPLKYGYYSYQYVMRKDGVSLVPPTEGSFYETRNIYTALVYYRSNIDRTDRLVGVRSTSQR